ncbi:MAG: copper resistance protein NlpE [Shewanella sp.]
MKLHLTVISLLALSISACSEQETPTADSTLAQEQTLQPKNSVPITDTSQTSLDWNGTYSGITPCASCEGIDTTLTLNQDNTYVLETRYLGDENEAKKVFTEAGSFKWNGESNKISLMGNASRQASPKQYLVGENQLLLLDTKGKSITGPLADHYRLEKHKD